MKNKALAAALAAFCSVAYGKDVAWAVRNTELKAQPFADAQTSGQLAEKQKVEVLARKVSWTQVKADDLTGWVKMLSLRFGDASTAPAAQAQAQAGALQSLFNLVTTGSSGSTVTTGARGLDESKLATPRPNKPAFDAMRSYAVSSPDAQHYAKTEKLDAKTVDYVATGDKK